MHWTCKFGFFEIKIELEANLIRFCSIRCAAAIRMNLRLIWIYFDPLNQKLKENS